MLRKKKWGVKANKWWEIEKSKEVKRIKKREKGKTSGNIWGNTTFWCF